MEKKNITFIVAVLFLNLWIEKDGVISPVSCSVIEKNCISKPFNSTCVNHDTYLNYTDDVEYLLQLEHEAMKFIEANVTNRYCRNYIKAALCVTLYPPCNGGVQKLCFEECDGLLNGGECSSDTIYLTEYMNNLSEYFENFIINCSNSLSFSNEFLSKIPCQSSECVSLLNIAETPASCIPLQLTPDVQVYSQYSLSLNSMIYKYTSESNFTKFLEAMKVAVEYLPQLSSTICLSYSAYFVYNYVFIPCNLTTGSPRPLCSSSCYLFRYHCEYQYTTIIAYANLLGIGIVDDCDNTFNHINSVFHYPNSSKDFEDDCVDFPDFTSIISNTVASNNSNDNNPICNISNAYINDTTIFITSTTASSTIDHTPVITNATSVTNSSDHLSSRTVIAYPVIVSSVVGGLLGLCLILCIVGLLIRIKFNRKRKTSSKFALSPINSLFYRMDINLKKDYAQADKTVFTDNDMEMVKKECQDLDELLISASAVELMIVLGEGEFGKVYKGTWLQKTKNGDTISQVVAVKTIKNFDHPNVLSVLGVGFDADDGLPFVVLPFMENGDLKTYLKSKRQKTATVDYLPEGIEQNTLFDICCQIAHGMNYLATRKIVHRDLAARNCMVGDNLNIKVADFGLARDVYIKEYYRQQSVGKVPVRWMAPEALHDKISNQKTDVWSYGITCWEVFSLGRTPYPSIPNHEILKYIDKGNRPPKPALCTDAMYTLMLKCWEADVDNRICFEEIVAELTRETNATETSGNKDYVNVKSCDVAKLTEVPSKAHANNDYVIVMPCDDATDLTKESSENHIVESSTYVSCNVAELTKEPSEDHATESCSDHKGYVTILSHHEINNN